MVHFLRGVEGLPEGLKEVGRELKEVEEVRGLLERVLEGEGVRAGVSWELD